ncbi:PHB depolymerase family esterase [Mycolicibacterium palauense]|uniref:PHB depolymerase family esterase n=1 Tax=Mycolicibacterium palauense TaxID=2034511 RepID=UPI000BFED9D7|nr:PHB depolymerase family esterase [Mycolicibacterium palauense]
MRAQDRFRRIARELGGVLPRSLDALSETPAWDGRSVRGLRQLGEVALDELVVTGMTLTAPPPQVHTDIARYGPVAAELRELGVLGAHSAPKPLQLGATRRRLAGPLAFEEITFEHDPGLPAGFGPLGAPATAVCHIVRHDDGPRPWLVWVHGAGQGGLSDFAVARVGRIHNRLGFNVALPVQPGHGVRRRWWPTYPDTDPLANVAGMMRAVSEVRAVIRWLQPEATAIALSGLSLGSGVAALVAGLEDGLEGVAVYTPIRGLNAMIANHLHRWGGAADEVLAVLNSDVVADLTSVIDPLAVEPLPPPQRRLIVGAWHDQMAMRNPALDLHERWGGELLWHDGGHVGHLLSARVHTETERFLRTVAGRT